jgi:hypothetical protein
MEIFKVLLLMMARVVISLFKVEGSGELKKKSDIQIWIKRGKRWCEHDHMQ